MGVNDRKESMGASQAKLSNVSLFDQFNTITCYQHSINSWSSVEKKQNADAILSALLSGNKWSGEAYANINALHYLRLDYSSLCLHGFST